MSNARGDAGQRDEKPRNGRLVSWFQRWRRPIHHWLSNRSSVPAADIDDLSQEVFLRLLRYTDDIAIENPQSYLFRITANVANEWRERAQQRQPHDNSWLDELRTEANVEPENAVAHNRAREHVQAVVRRLPPRQREVLLLHVNEGLTYKQITDRLKLSPRIVLRDLTKAYSHLRGKLDLEDLEAIE